MIGLHSFRKNIDEGLVASYYTVEDYKEFKEAVYGYAKKILTEVAKKRNLTINDEDTFEINEILQNDIDLEDFDLTYYKDYNLLINYMKNKTKEMNATEIEEFYNKFYGRIGSLQDGFREFMTGYIPKIINNIYALHTEINDNKINEEISVEQENTDWIDTDIEKQEEDTLNQIDESNDFGLVSDDYEWLEENKNHQEEKVKEKISDEELLSFIKFLNTYPKLSQYKGNGQKASDKLSDIVKNKKLSEFYDNKEFYKNFHKNTPTT